MDDLEQWIAEREVVAGSHELGQDYEHVTVSFFLSVAYFGDMKAQRDLAELIMLLPFALFFFLFLCTDAEGQVPGVCS